MDSPCSRAPVQPPLFVNRLLSTSFAHMRTPRSSETKCAKSSSKLALDHVLTEKSAFSDRPMTILKCPCRFFAVSRQDFRACACASTERMRTMHVHSLTPPFIVLQVKWLLFVRTNSSPSSSHSAWCKRTLFFSHVFQLTILQKDNELIQVMFG